MINFCGSRVPMKIFKHKYLNKKAVWFTRLSMKSYRHKMLNSYLLYGPHFFPPDAADSASRCSASQYLLVGQHSHPRVVTPEDKGPFRSRRPSFAPFLKYLNNDILVIGSCTCFFTGVILKASRKFPCV